MHFFFQTKIMKLKTRTVDLKETLKRILPWSPIWQREKVRLADLGVNTGQCWYVNKTRSRLKVTWISLLCSFHVGQRSLSSFLLPPPASFPHIPCSKHLIQVLFLKSLNSCQIPSLENDPLSQCVVSDCVLRHLNRVAVKNSL